MRNRSGAAFLRMSLCLLAACSAAPRRAAPDAGLLTARVSDECVLQVQDTGVESETCWSLACTAKDVKLGCDLSALRQVGEMSPSPDGRWLAVVSVGEGHPMLEVVDLRRLLAGQGYEALALINPYPGTINLERWTDGALLVTSDMPLPYMPLAGNADDLARRMLPDQEVFALDVGTWTARAVPAAADQ